MCIWRVEGGRGGAMEERTRECCRPYAHPQSRVKSVIAPTRRWVRQAGGGSRSSSRGGGELAGQQIQCRKGNAARVEGVARGPGAPAMRSRGRPRKLLLGPVLQAPPQQVQQRQAGASSASLPPQASSSWAKRSSSSLKRATSAAAAAAAAAAKWGERVGMWEVRRQSC